MKITAKDVIAQGGGVAGKMTVRQLKSMLNTMKEEQPIVVQLENKTLYAVSSIDVSQSAGGPMVVIEVGTEIGSARPETGNEGAY